GALPREADRICDAWRHVRRAAGLRGHAFHVASVPRDPDLGPGAVPDLHLDHRAEYVVRRRRAVPHPVHMAVERSEADPAAAHPHLDEAQPADGGAHDRRVARPGDAGPCGVGRAPTRPCDAAAAAGTDAEHTGAQHVTDYAARLAPPVMTGSKTQTVGRSGNAFRSSLWPSPLPAVVPDRYMASRRRLHLDRQSADVSAA